MGERAAGQGLSLSRYVISVLEDDLDRPATIDEWLAELATDPMPRSIGFSPSASLRELRDELDRS